MELLFQLCISTVDTVPMVVVCKSSHVYEFFLMDQDTHSVATYIVCILIYDI